MSATKQDVYLIPASFTQNDSTRYVAKFDRVTAELVSGARLSGSARLLQNYDRGHGGQLAPSQCLGSAILYHGPV